MAEATTESPSSILPKELMIEILSRIEFCNPLQLRCVCKWWKSLVVDPQFTKKHVLKSVTEIVDLVCVGVERVTSLESLQEEEDDEEAVEEEEEEEEEEDGDDDDDDDDDDEEDVEGEDVEEEQSLMSVIAKIREEKEVAPMDNLLKVLRYLKGKYESIRDDMQAVEDRAKCLLNYVQVCSKSERSSSSYFDCFNLI